MVIVAMRADDGICLFFSWIQGTALVLLDRLRLEETAQGPQLERGVSCCSAAACVDEDNDLVIELGVDVGVLAPLVVLDDEKGRRIEPTTGEAR